MNILFGGIINGFNITLRGFLGKEKKASKATYIGGAIFLVVLFSTYFIFNKLSIDYKNIDQIIVVIYYIINLYFINLIYNKIGGPDYKAKKR